VSALNGYCLAGHSFDKNLHSFAHQVSPCLVSWDLLPVELVECAEDRQIVGVCDAEKFFFPTELKFKTL
jgi:hypothetical protein